MSLTRPLISLSFFFYYYGSLLMAQPAAADDTVIISRLKGEFLFDGILDSLICKHVLLSILQILWEI